MKKFFSFFIFILLISLSFSQNSNLTLLCVAAHPDDEDGATLAYYSKIMGYNAYTVFYTRGEGGQNEIGPELDDKLGKIREQECYNAAAIQGSKAFFLGCIDFGYSKTAKETFKFWGGKDSVEQKIVYMIRVLRPDVVITNHDTVTTTPDRQHGNHQAVGITIYEAFDKAADPNYHTEQLVNGITPWQVKKLYFRVVDTTKTDNIFRIGVNQKAASGEIIFEIARNALNQHKTQGMDKIDWDNIPEVVKERHYELVRSDKMYPLEGNDLFTGLVLNEKLSNVKNLKSYATGYDYKTVNPQDSLRFLRELTFNKDAYVGVIKTYDNTIENTLKAFNVKYEILDSANYVNNKFSRYNVILLDIRTYLYRPDVAGNNEKLLNYVYKGGNVVCFYNKQRDWNGQNYAPYPITITFARVTEEDAKVTILNAANPLFGIFNKITEDDWDGWIQERNIYLPAGDTALTSGEYKKLLQMSDEDDPVPSTSLLYAKYGAGHYTYCSLALYRQLKIFNRGALKLFLNMISLPRIDIRYKGNE